MGFETEDVEPARLRSRGVGTMRAVTPGGGTLLVKIYGRDAWDGQLLSSVWSFLWYRDETPMLTLSRLQQVEHEAFVTLLAERAQVPVLPVVAAGPVSNDALLVVHLEGNRCLPTRARPTRCWPICGVAWTACTERGSRTVLSTPTDWWYGAEARTDDRDRRLRAGDGPRHRRRRARRPSATARHDGALRGHRQSHRRGLARTGSRSPDRTTRISASGRAHTCHTCAIEVRTDGSGHPPEGGGGRRWNRGTRARPTPPCDLGIPAADRVDRDRRLGRASRRSRTSGWTHWSRS